MKIVSVHFPKAAGSSLKAQWADTFGDTLLLDYDHDPISSATTETVALPHDKMAVHGHFSPRRYEGADAYRLTFLRHPVSNLISIYFFWRVMPPFNLIHSRFLEERPSIVDFARYPAFRTLMSGAYFGNYDMKRFDFIGFHESRTADIPRLANDIGLPLSPTVKDNVTPSSVERQRVEEDRLTIAKITDLLSADVAFYESLRC
jgi:hypothetical protein